MGDIDLGGVIVNLMITGPFYCLIPTIVRIAIKKSMEKKRATEFAIINSIIIFFCFVLFFVFTAQASGTTRKTADLSAAVIWFFAVRALLMSGRGKNKFNETLNTQSSVLDLSTDANTLLESKIKDLYPNNDFQNDIEIDNLTRHDQTSSASMKTAISTEPNTERIENQHLDNNKLIPRCIMCGAKSDLLSSITFVKSVR
jgi:hypothetical protein